MIFLMGAKPFFIFSGRENGVKASWCPKMWEQLTGTGKITVSICRLSNFEVTRSAKAGQVFWPWQLNWKTSTLRPRESSGVQEKNGSNGSKEWLNFVELCWMLGDLLILGWNIWLTGQTIYFLPVSEAWESELRGPRSLQGEPVEARSCRCSLFLHH